MPSSGLPALDWASGITATGNDVSKATDAATARGRAADAVRLRVDGSDPAALTPGAPLWTKASGTGAQLIVEVPLTLGGADLKRAGDGTSAESWATLAGTLRTVAGPKPAVVALTIPADADPARVKAVASRVAATVKAAAPGTLIELVAPAGTDPSALDAAWPGDAVDLVGIALPSDKPVPQLVTGKGGLADWSDWAASKGKRVAFSWTITRTTTPSEVTSVRSWLDVTAKANRLAVETIAIAPDANKDALAAYNASW